MTQIIFKINFIKSSCFQTELSHNHQDTVHSLYCIVRHWASLLLCYLIIRPALRQHSIVNAIGRESREKFVFSGKQCLIDYILFKKRKELESKEES